MVYKSSYWAVAPPPWNAALASWRLSDKPPLGPCGVRNPGIIKLRIKEPQRRFGRDRRGSKAPRLEARGAGHSIVTRMSCAQLGFSHASHAAPGTPPWLVEV